MLHEYNYQDNHYFRKMKNVFWTVCCALLFALIIHYANAVVTSMTDMKNMVGMTDMTEMNSKNKTTKAKNASMKESYDKDAGVFVMVVIFSITILSTISKCLKIIFEIISDSGVFK